MTKYEELKNRIVKYVPEIMELRFGCDVKIQGEIVKIIGAGHTGNYIFYERPCGDIQREKQKNITEILGRDIILEDVIICFANISSNYTGKEFPSVSHYLGHLILQTISDWKLNIPLHKQSEETIDKLLEIIK